MLRPPFFGLSVAVAGALLLSACEEPPQITQVQCRGVVQYFSLRTTAYERCIRDASYRRELISRRDGDFAPRFVKGHNTDLHLMSLRGRAASDFLQLGSIDALPVKGAWALKDEALIGKKFTFDARITFHEEAAMSDGAPPFVVIRLLGPDGQELSGVGAYALSDYQRLFLSKYCLVASIPICEGQVFVEFMKEPNGFYIRGELVGANIKPASVDAVRAAMGSLNFQ